MNKSLFSINWTVLTCLVVVSGWNISEVNADIVELDGFSVSTNQLSVSGGGEDQESTANYEGLLAGISTRTLMVGSDFADASAQADGGQVSFDASGSDFSGRVSYEFDVSLSILAFGNGMYVEVDSLTADYDLGGCQLGRQWRPPLRLRRIDHVGARTLFAAVFFVCRCGSRDTG